MNFLLTMFVCILVANIMIIVVKQLLKWSSTVLPFLYKTLIELVVRLFYRDTTTTAAATTQENDEFILTDTSIKTLKRHRRAIIFNDTNRRNISRYITRIENGKGNRITQYLWKCYVYYVPDYYRMCDPEQGSKYALPRWLERIFAIEIEWAIACVTLFVILVLCMQLWLPYFSTTPAASNELNTKAYALVGHTECETNTSESSYSYCFLKCSTTNNCVIQDELLVYANDARHKHNTHNVVLNKTGVPLYYDSDRFVYYSIALMKCPIQQTNWFFASMHDVDNNESHDWQQEIKYVKEHDLVGVLDYLDKYEMSMYEPVAATTTITEHNNHACICPLYLNIVSNVSFLFDTSEEKWIIMSQPTVSRNNTFAELVASTIVNNNKNSLFYTRHKHWHTYAHKNTSELIHYDSFVVEYTAVDSLDTNDLLIQKDSVLAQNGLEHLKMVHSVAPNTYRKQIALSGSDAICFTYCQSMQNSFTAH